MSRLLGTSIQDARKRAGLTQADVAERLSVSKAAVGQWERGVTEPSTINLFRVCNMLGIDVATATGGLVHLSEIDPSAGKADDDDRAYRVEDRRPIPGNKTLFDSGPMRVANKDRGIPILQVAPVPRGMTTQDMFGKKVEAGLVIWNEAVDVCPRPIGIGLDDDVICIYLPHDRVGPRYRIGELIFLKKQDGRIGDYVMLEFIGSSGEPSSSFAVFGKLLKQTVESYVVEETNPPHEYTLSREDCFNFYRALLTHELFGK